MYEYLEKIVEIMDEALNDLSNEVFESFLESIQDEIKNYY